MKTAYISLLALLLFCLALFTSCTNGTYYGDEYVPDHECTFDEEDTSEAYLATPATCTQAATYYYRCGDFGCPLKGSETFEYGYPQHSFDGVTCTACGVKESQGLTFDIDSTYDESTYEYHYFYRVIGRGDCTDSVIYVPKTHEGCPVVSVSGFDGDTLLTELVIPEGIEVVGTFTDCINLTRVSLPTTVTTIADQAFQGCTALESINLAESCVETLMEYAFSGCTSLKTVTFPSTLTEIGQGAFAGSGLTEITVPATIKNVPATAFKGCESLTRVTLEGAVSIGNHAFAGCTALSYVCFPSAFEFPQDIRSAYFSGCHSLSEIALTGTQGKYVAKDGCLIDTEAKKLIFGTKDCVIPAGGEVLTIGNNAFAQCKGLVSIVIPEGVTTIENYAFTECRDLTSITYPSTLQSVNHYDMSRLPRLFEINDFSELTNTYGFYWYFVEYREGKPLHVNRGEILPTRVELEGDYVFYQDDDELLLINYLGDDLSFTLPDPEAYGAYAILGVDIPSTVISLTVPSGVTGIRHLSSESVTELILPSSITSIGSLTLPAVKTLTLPASLLEIGELTLPLVTEITLPDSLTNIGTLTLPLVTDLSVPNRVRHIESLSCSRLLTLSLGESIESLGEYAFSACPHLVELYNRSSLEIGLEDYGLAALIDVLQGDGQSKLITTEQGYVFYMDYDHTYLITYLGEDTEITLPAHPNPTQINRYYEIHSYAFTKTNVTGVTVPSCVLAIAPYAFYDASIEKVELPAGLLQIGDMAFYGCRYLTELHLPASVSHIGDTPFPFSHGDHFTLYFDGDINDYATINFTEDTFESNWHFSNIFIGEKNLLEYTSITLNDEIVQIGSYAFNDWTHLKNITLGNSIRSIEEGAFDNAGVEYVVIGPKVMGVGKDAFYTRSKFVLFDLALLGMENDPEDDTGIRSCTSLVLHTRPTQTEDGHLIATEGGVTYLCIYNGVEGDLVIPSLPSENGYELAPYLFYDCDSITSIVIPEGVTAIGELAFASAANLKTVTVPASVTSIGRYAFSDCYALTDIYFDGSEEEWAQMEARLGNYDTLGIPNGVTVHFGK